jgi:hypothetical protein
VDFLDAERDQMSTVGAGGGDGDLGAGRDATIICGCSAMLLGGPNAIGQLVDVTATLAQVTVSRAGRLLALTTAAARHHSLNHPPTPSPPRRCASSPKPARHR